MQLSLKINATFVENKCNFLTFLLQQKLALRITQGSYLNYTVEKLSFHVSVRRASAAT